MEQTFYRLCYNTVLHNHMYKYYFTIIILPEVMNRLMWAKYCILLSLFKQFGMCYFVSAIVCPPVLPGGCDCSGALCFSYTGKVCPHPISFAGNCCHSTWFVNLVLNSCEHNENLKQNCYWYCLCDIWYFTTFPNTESEKRVENIMHSGVFLTHFRVFGNAIKHCLECFLNLLSRN